MYCIQYGVPKVLSIALWADFVDMQSNVASLLNWWYLVLDDWTIETLWFLLVMDKLVPEIRAATPRDKKQEQPINRKASKPSVDAVPGTWQH